MEHWPPSGVFSPHGPRIPLVGTPASGAHGVPENPAAVSNRRQKREDGQQLFRLTRTRLVLARESAGHTLPLVAHHLETLVALDAAAGAVLHSRAAGALLAVQHGSRQRGAAVACGRAGTNRS